MAASEESCDGNPDFAVICSFITKFGNDCGVNVTIPYLQQMLEDTKNVHEDLAELHIHLLRRGRKRVTKEKWEKSLIKFCHEYSSVDAWELERFGYKKAKLSVKLELLKRLLELQFDSNAKFKSEVNKHEAHALRIPPIGRDLDGQVYWYQLDREYNMRLYRQRPEDESTWQLLCSNTDHLKNLLANLQKNITKEESLEDNTKTSPDDVNSIPVKMETDCDDLTSRMSDTKPYTIIIKTEKKEVTSSNTVTDTVKSPINDILKSDNEITLIEKEEDIPSRGTPNEPDVKQEKKEDNQMDTTELVVKKEIPSKSEEGLTLMDVDDKKIEKSVEKASGVVSNSDIEMTDVEKETEDKKKQLSPLDKDITKTPKDSTLIDTPLSLKDATSISNRPSPKKTISPLGHSSPKDSLPSVEHSLTNDTIPSLTKSVSSEDATLKEKYNLPSDVTSPLEKHTEAKYKGSKIKLYEKWSNEKKQAAAAQSTTDSRQNLYSPKEAAHSRKLLLGEKVIDHKELSESTLKKSKSSLSSSASQGDEVPMDLSVSFRSDDVTSKNVTGNLASDLTTGNKQKLLLDQEKTKHNYNGGNEKHSSLLDLDTSRSSVKCSKSSFEAPRPFKKKHLSMAIEESNKETSDLSRKSVIFEVKNSKLLNQLQDNKHSGDSLIKEKTPTNSGFSHLQALQNMCNENPMTCFQSSVIRSASPDMRLKTDSGLAKFGLSPAEKPSYNETTCDNLSQKYKFNSSQLSGDVKQFSESDVPPTLLKSNLHTSSEAASKEDTLKKSISIFTTSASEVHESATISAKCSSKFPSESENSGDQLKDNIEQPESLKMKFTPEVESLDRHSSEVYKADSKKCSAFEKQSRTNDHSVASIIKKDHSVSKCVISDKAIKLDLNKISVKSSDNHKESVDNTDKINLPIKIKDDTSVCHKAKSDTVICSEGNKVTDCSSKDDKSVSDYIPPTNAVKQTTTVSVKQETKAEVSKTVAIQENVQKPSEEAITTVESSKPTNIELKSNKVMDTKDIDSYKVDTTGPELETLLQSKTTDAKDKKELSCSPEINSAVVSSIESQSLNTCEIGASKPANINLDYDKSERVEQNSTSNVHLSNVNKKDDVSFISNESKTSNSANESSVTSQVNKDNAVSDSPKENASSSKETSDATLQQKCTSFSDSTDVSVSESIELPKNKESKSIDCAEVSLSPKKDEKACEKDKSPTIEPEIIKNNSVPDKEGSLIIGNISVSSSKDDNLNEDDKKEIPLLLPEFSTTTEQTTSIKLPEENTLDKSLNLNCGDKNEELMNNLVTDNKLEPKKDVKETNLNSLSKSLPSKLESISKETEFILTNDFPKSTNHSPEDVSVPDEIPKDNNENPTVIGETASLKIDKLSDVLKNTDKCSDSLKRDLVPCVPEKLNNRSEKEICTKPETEKFRESDPEKCTVSSTEGITNSKQENDSGNTLPEDSKNKSTLEKDEPIEISQDIPKEASLKSVSIVSADDKNANKTGEVLKNKIEKHNKKCAEPKCPSASSQKESQMNKAEKLDSAVDDENVSKVTESSLETKERTKDDVQATDKSEIVSKENRDNKKKDTVKKFKESKNKSTKSIRKLKDEIASSEAEIPSSGSSIQFDKKDSVVKLKSTEEDKKLKNDEPPSISEDNSDRKDNSIGSITEENIKDCPVLSVNEGLLGKIETSSSINTKCDKSLKTKLKINIKDPLGVYFVMNSRCLETKIRHPSFEKLKKIPPSTLTTKPKLITTFSMDTTDDVQVIQIVSDTSPTKKKRGRLRQKAPDPKAIESKATSLNSKATKQKPSANSKKATDTSGKDSFSIPEGFLEILSNTQTEGHSIQKEPQRKPRGRKLKISAPSLENSESESTPIKRSRRIQDMHQKKMSELAVEMEREQRILEQLAKKSAKKDAPQKSPAKAKEVKPPRAAKSKFQPPTPEETCMESKRVPRKMNSRSRNMTKMTLLYEDESKDSEFSTSRETEKSKKRRRGRGTNGKKSYKPWDLSSESESSLEELTEEEEEEEHEEPLVFEVNEDEFACEEIEEDDEPIVVRRARTAKKVPEDANIEEPVVNDDKPCSKCGKFDRPEWILLCDKCDNGYHTNCLIPPLMIIPEGDWYCQPCEHMFLCECLQKELHKLEVVLKQREREELRKQRLAYVGISLDNVLKPEKKEKSDDSSKEDEEESDEEEQKGGKSRERASSSDEERQKKLYGKRSVRARRNVNYQFKEYDELIASAIGDEMLGVKLPEDAAEVKEDDDRDDDSDKAFQARFPTRKKKKTKRLNDLDITDEDDSGEEYKGSSSDSEQTAAPSRSGSDAESAASGEWKIVRTKGKKSKRKTRRGRRDDSDEDWEDENDSDTYRPVTRRSAAQKAVSYREISSDDEWDPKPKAAAKKRKKAFSSEDSEASYKKKKPKTKKKRVRKWASSDSSEESERSINFSESSREESEDKWKVKKSSEGDRLKININKKVLSSDENESSQESAPKKQPNKIVSEEEEESEGDDDEEEDDEEEDEDEEGSSEEDDDDDEEEEEEHEEVKPSKLEVKTPKPDVKALKPEVKDPKTIIKPSKPELKSSLQNKEPVKAEVAKVAEPLSAVKDSNSVVVPVEPIKEKVTVSTIHDKAPLRTVKKDATKMVPCVIPYDKSPKSGHGTTPDEESEKEITKEKNIFQNTPKPAAFAKSVPQQTPQMTIPRPPSAVIPSTTMTSKPVNKTVPVPDRRPFAGSIVQPFSNIDEDVDSDDEVPLERIPTAVPNPLPNKALVYDREAKYTPAKELPGFNYTAPEEKCFPPTYSALAPFQDYTSRPSPLKPSLVETYNRSSPSKLTPLDSYSQTSSAKGSYPLKPSLIETYNRSSPSKLTPLDSYSQSSSPKGFISLDSYSEARKKKQHFYGNPAAEPERPPSDSYQREIGFPPEPTPFPPSPSTYQRSTPPHIQRDPGTPPRFHSQYPDGYAPPRSPEYYHQNSQYYPGEERVPRPAYQPNYVPPEQGPPYVPNPYVATPVPQPNGGFMIDTLLRARNPEDGEDELTGVTDIVSYITQE